MSSKKARKKLKAQYPANPDENRNEKGIVIVGKYKERFSNPIYMEWVLHDRPLIIEFFKQVPNIWVTSKEIAKNIHLLSAKSQSAISQSIKRINQYTDFKIESKSGKGYIYHGKAE